MNEEIIIPGYKVLRTLGSGGMAKVYLAVQESFGREVALKLMSPLLNSDPSFAARFMREARIISQINHSSIVPVFDVGQFETHHYLSMEYLPGGDLKRRITKDGVDIALAVNVTCAIASALDLAHRKGFIHRDIKPENILFREDRTPVLTDFGIARAFRADATQTVAGMLVGTPAYMSPEQIKGLELDARTDLYSLGIVFYEMLTGSVPFKSDSSVSVAVKHLQETIPPLPAEFAAYQAFFSKLTARDRDQRFASGLDVINALREISGGSSRPITVRRPRTAEESGNPTPAAAALAPRALARTGSIMKMNKGWGIGIGVVTAATLVIGAELLFGGPRLTSANTTRQEATNAPTESPAQTAAAPAETSAPAESAPAPQPAEAQVAAVEPASSDAATPAPAAVAHATQPQVSHSVASTPVDATAHRKEIEREVTAGDEAYVIGSMTEAAGHYQAALRLDPRQPDALAGMKRVNEVLASQGQPVQTTTSTPVATTPAYPTWRQRAAERREAARERREQNRDTPPPSYDGNIPGIPH